MFWLERGGMLLRNGESCDEMGGGRVVSFFGMERGLSERLVRRRSVDKESGKIQKKRERLWSYSRMAESNDLKNPIKI